MPTIISVCAIDLKLFTEQIELRAHKPRKVYSIPSNAYNLPLPSNIKLVCFSFPLFLERHQHRGSGLFSVPVQNTKATPAHSKQTPVECGARTGTERDLSTAHTVGDTIAQLSLHFLQQKLLGVPTPAECFDNWGWEHFHSISGKPHTALQPNT